MQLKPFNVTVCIFEPAKGLESGQTYVLPVDSPDAEYACASTIANAASSRRRRKTGRNGSRPAKVSNSAVSLPTAREIETMEKIFRGTCAKRLTGLIYQSCSARMRP